MIPPDAQRAMARRAGAEVVEVNVYQMRSSDVSSLSRIARLWYHVICASTACTIDSSGQPSANARMYFSFRGESPFM